MTDFVSLQADNGQHDAAVDALYARAFGPGRLAKAATRLREGNMCLRQYSFLAFRGNELVGACRLWPVVVGKADPALFLGPIAVDATIRSAGLGQRLVEACLAAVDAANDPCCVLLVGDHAYFGKMGFEIIPRGAVTLPGPVDPTRLLWRQVTLANHLPIGRLNVPRATSQIG
jgi:predicted N-acetyltransferase YhbS